MPIVTPRVIALLVVLALAGPLMAPLAAPAGRGCARCVKAERCCCAARTGSGGCALARPCAPGSDTGDFTAPPVVDKALPVTSIAAAAPPAPPRDLWIASLVEPSDPSPKPPDPPPRASL